MYQNFIIPYLYESQHVLGDTPPIIRSLKLHWQPLVFQRPTTFHVWKTRGYQCRFRLLMMGGVSPKTCWASYKCGIINFSFCCILLDFSLWIEHILIKGYCNIFCCLSTCHFAVCPHVIPLRYLEEKDNTVQCCNTSVSHFRHSPLSHLIYTSSK